MKIASVNFFYLLICIAVYEVKAENKVANMAVTYINKTLLETACTLHKLRIKLSPHTHFLGTDPCEQLHGQQDPLPVGYDPHVEMASMKPPDILKNIFDNKNKNQVNKTEGVIGTQKAPVDKVSENPNKSENSNNGQLFPNNPFLNNGKVPNTNGAGSGIPNIQNPNGQLQPFNPYPPNWNFPNNGFNPNGQWNPNNGFPNYPMNPNGQYPYPGQYPNQNQFYPNGQPMWGANGNFPNQGGFVGTNTWGNNQGSIPGPFPNTNLPNNGQNPNWSFYPNQQYPGQVNNGQYPNVNGVPNWTPNQNTNQGPGKNQPQFPNPWGFNPNPSQGSVQNGQYPNNNGQQPNQGTNTNGQPVWGSNPNGNQGSGQNNLLPSNNQNQGSMKYPNENGQPIWSNQNPNQGSGQNGQFPIINNQPVWGPNPSQNEKDSKHTAGGIVFPGAESQGPGGRSILNNNNGTYIAATPLSTTSTTIPSSSCNTKTTSTTPTPSVTPSSQDIRPEVTETAKEILTSAAPATSTTPKIKPKCRPMSHSSKRRKNNDDYDDEEPKEKESDLPYCDESTDRPETTVTIDGGKSLIGGVKSNCPEGFVADKAGVCREQY